MDIDTFEKVKTIILIISSLLFQVPTKNHDGRVLLLTSAETPTIRLLLPPSRNPMVVPEETNYQERRSNRTSIRDVLSLGPCLYSTGISKKLTCRFSNKRGMVFGRVHESTVVSRQITVSTRWNLMLRALDRFLLSSRPVFTSVSETPKVYETTGNTYINTTIS